MARIVSRFWTERVSKIALILVLTAGLGLRVWNINFDNGMGSHPDERSTACFYAPTLHLPNTWDELLDPHKSPLNPLWNAVTQERRSFTYGHFPLYLGVALGNLLHFASPVAESVGFPTAAIRLMATADTACDSIAVSGRLAIALLDTLTIFLVFLLGRRIYDHRAGMLAAAFYTFTAQAIQLSHFFAMDPASTTFTVLAVLGAVQMVQDRTWRAACFAGLGAGLAISSKFSALPILLAPVVAGFLAVWQEYQAVDRSDRPVDAKSQIRIALLVLTAMAVTLVSFALTSPYAVLDWHNFIQATLVEQGRMVRGVADMPFTRQYRNTLPYLYFIQEQLRWGVWWPLGLLALAGTIFSFTGMIRSAYRILYSCILGRGKSWKRKWISSDQVGNLILWSWVLPYFGLTGAFLAKFNRYMSPILPFTAIFAAALIWHLWSPRNDFETRPQGTRSNGDEARHRLNTASIRRIAALALAGIAVAGSIFWSLAYVNGVYAREHTWISASRWIYENVPQGSVILWELWDDPLPKSIPGEPGMDMGSTGLRNIDWSPYEEDTYEKYLIMRETLREADYVAYSSKRIYDSVDELPQRYPMTNRYYQAMWDGTLGFELVLDETSPPQLFGWSFQDRSADESWSLYDHPQVTLFRKVRDLSDEEYDDLFAESWETAVPYFRGKDSPLSPLLDLVGLGNTPEAEHKGLVSGIIALISGQASDDLTPVQIQRSLTLETPLAELPVVDNYRWNYLASENAILSMIVWWFVLTLLGWLAWPWCFIIFRSFRDRGYLLSRTFGWLVAGWLMWTLVSYGVVHNTVVSSWLTVSLLAIIGIAVCIPNRRKMWLFLQAEGGLLIAGEVLALAAFLGFVFLRMANPDLWQPWFGGEKFMEFAFLNGILRSPTFPPVDPHFAGGFINYYYFGLYLVSFLVKLTGIYAEVSFNLVIPALFALTITNSFSIAFTAIAMRQGRSHWRTSFAPALLAPLFVALFGNLDGFAQVMRRLAAQGAIHIQSTIVGLPTLLGSLDGLLRVLRGEGEVPGYDFWAPSRVIPNTINEFPYWSFLFADLHPHLIGIPFSVLFLALLLVLLHQYDLDWGANWRRRTALLIAFSFVLGALAAVNLWELPTYFALGVLALLVCQFRGSGRIRWLRTLGISILYLAGAYILYLPFFHHYVNIGASGIGLVRDPDTLGPWLLIWGFLGFVVVSWLIVAAKQRPYPVPRLKDGPTTVVDEMLISSSDEDVQEVTAGGTNLIDANSSDTNEETVGCSTHESPTGVERWLSLLFNQFDRLPRAAHLHELLVANPTLGYLLGIATLPVTLCFALLALLSGRIVLAMCIAALGVAWLLLWRRGPESDASTLFVAVLSTAGLSILAGTQLIYLKDFLQGGDWYRMNTLFKFFTQVWVLWGIAAAIALPRIWRSVFGYRRIKPQTDTLPVALDEQNGVQIHVERTRPTRSSLIWRIAWAIVCVTLFLSSLVFLFWGTPTRLGQRMVGWRPPYGTLNSLDFMQHGSYTWPDASHLMELEYDWHAIQWLLKYVRGNPVLVESSEVDYYRAGGTRIASLTGISGLRGMHESEQRYADALSERETMHREFWSTTDLSTTLQLIEDLDISLIYVGQLERHQHPDAVDKLNVLLEQGQLMMLYENSGVQIYAVPGKLRQSQEGYYYPSGAEPDDVGRFPNRSLKPVVSKLELDDHICQRDGIGKFT